MSVLFFDLDNTLYPQTLGVVGRIDRRINEYLAVRVGIPADEVDDTRQRFWAEHGTTLRGLMLRHAVDADDYLEFVHDIQLEDLLEADATLASLLGRLPGRKVVFSNASRAHVRRVLRLLGLDAAFEAVIGLEDLGYVPKPDPHAFQIALERCRASGREATLIDDLRPNLETAKRVGMRTVWVAAPHDSPDEIVDHVVASIRDLAPIFSI